MATQAPSKPLRVADIKNMAYNSGKIDVMTPGDRVSRAINKLTPAKKAAMLRTKTDAVFTFSNYAAKAKKLKYADLPLAQAAFVKLSDIFIDASIQRELNLKWAFDIITTFDPLLAEPIRVAKDPLKPTRYLAWDGQHTLIALYIIITECFKEDPANILIPVSISQFKTRAEMRNAFIKLNGPLKMKLDVFDTWVQQCLGVRVDGAKDKEWVATAAKQAHLEANGLFPTHAKLNDTDEVGAITNLQEMDRISVESVAKLATYLGKVCYDPGNNVKAPSKGRAAYGTEVEIMSDYFDQAIIDPATKKPTPVPATYADDVAQAVLISFNADFSKDGKFWTKVRDSYHSWHYAMKLSGQPKLDRHSKHGLPFITEQLKQFPVLVNYVPPVTKVSTDYTPDATMLFSTMPKTTKKAKNG
jgi:hypothetical protein